MVTTSRTETINEAPPPFSKLHSAFHDSSFLICFLPQVAKAENTVQQIDAELKDLNATLANIEQSRPIENLTVSEMD
jgi:hypothetical protein